MENDKVSENEYLSFEGPFNIQIISALAKFLEENADITEFARRKLYKVFIELTQNVALYSFERIKQLDGSIIGKGKVSIISCGSEFKCITLNKIEKTHAEILVKNCLEINTSTYADLKKKKKQLRKLATVKDTGAHIGLIMIFMYSENILDFEIIKGKEESETYFKLSATINKNANSFHQTSNSYHNKLKNI